MSDLIDERLCNVWNTTVPNGPTAFPENMWDLCRLLSQNNLVIGNRQDVTTVEIGPFRALSTLNQADIIDTFVDTIVPVVIAQYCTKQTVVQAVTGPLMFLTKVFCLALRSGSVIKDPLVWNVLIFIKQENLEGRHPSKEGVFKFISTQSSNDQDVESRVDEAIRTLMSIKPVVGKTPIAVLSLDDKGGLVSSA